MTSPFITVIGAGNMGSSLIGGLIQNGHPADRISATDPSLEKCQQLQDTFHIQTSTDNQQAIAQSDLIIFAVKPQIFKQVVEPLAATIKKRGALIISVAAGIRESSIQQWLGGDVAIVRAMPNTPALISCGATGLYANAYVSAKQRDMAESTLRAVGLVVWVDEENKMDIVTALSGSGPAYFFLMMESMQEAAESLGLAKEAARLLTLQTALGAARMAIESSHSLAELRKNVTSPGGTTEKAINSLENQDIRSMFKNAILAAANRSKELGDEQ